MFDELWYVKCRQRELLHEAAAYALAAQCQPDRPTWWARLLEALTTGCSLTTWRVSEHAHPCAVPTGVSVTASQDGGHKR